MPRLLVGKSNTLRVTGVLFDEPAALEANSAYAPELVSCRLVNVRVELVAPTIETKPLPLSTFHWLVMGWVPVNEAARVMLPPTYTLVEGLKVVSAAKLRMLVTVPVLTIWKPDMPPPLGILRVRV